MLLSDTQVTVVPYTALYKTPVPDSSLNVNETTDQGRNAYVLDLNGGDGVFSRDFGADISWPLGVENVLRIWQPSYIPQPEDVYSRAGDWMDGGYPGAKWVQGILLEGDSNGAAKSFSLEDADTSTVHTLLECPVTMANQNVVALSCIPFIAHNVRVVSSDGVAWNTWNARLVFQPYPELAMNWTPPQTSLGLIGWGHLRETNIAYISTMDLTLTLLFDSWPAIQITVPNSGGSFRKTKFTIPANKFKLMQPSLVAPTPPGFRLFAPDLEFKVGQWGRTEPYRVVQPFGGPNQAGALV